MQWFSTEFQRKINSQLETETQLSCKGCPSKPHACAGCNNKK
jgi:hypothetical protein